MTILIIMVIAVSLSMDAFSLALAYGTLGLNRKKISQLSLIVGIYHFFMPLIGLFIGSKIIKLLPINPNLLVVIILTFIGIQMIIESFKEEKNMDIMGLLQMFIFGFAVSIDSFSVGISLNAITNNYLVSSILFSITSFIFTYLGLLLGKRINSIIGRASTVFGGIILIIIGLIYLIG